MTSRADLIERCLALEVALRNLLNRADAHFDGPGKGWQEQERAREVLDGPVRMETKHTS